MDVAKFLENVKQALNIGLVFGESREIGDKTIIPVAYFSYGMGHGEGRGNPGFKIERKEDPSVGSTLTENKGELSVETNSKGHLVADKTAMGHGFGGGFKARPVGIYQISKNRTLFIPVISAQQIILVAFAILWMFKRSKRKRR